MRLIKFSAEWCGPCHALDKELEKCRAEFELIRVDVEEEPGIARLHMVRSVPTLILLDDEDKEIGRLSGKQTAAAIDRFVNDAA